MVFLRKKELENFVASDPILARVASVYPFRITDHLVNYIERPDDVIWRQFVPSKKELEDGEGMDDPLGEEHLSPVNNLVHRYTDRVLWLVTSSCAAFCRFCTRKRIWKRRIITDDRTIEEIHKYIATHKEIRDVILSGGDPLLLSAKRLEKIFYKLRSIKHVRVIRIGTRLPVVHPAGVTGHKLRLLSKYQPIYIMLHINHPLELSHQTMQVINSMADLGIPMASQTVLLKGINDNSAILGELFFSLLALRVRPYYLLQMDLIKGASHFRVPISRGLEIMAELRHNLSGLAMPHYMIDLPGGGGKIELAPHYIVKIENNKIIFRNRNRGISSYPLFENEAEVVKSFLGIK